MGDDENARWRLSHAEEAARGAGWPPETDLGDWIRAVDRREQDLENRREDAVKALGRIGEALVNAGFLGGDRDVQMANLVTLIRERDTARRSRSDAMKREAASLREYEAMVAERDDARKSQREAEDALTEAETVRDAAKAELARLSDACRIVVEAIDACDCTMSDVAAVRAVVRQ